MLHDVEGVLAEPTIFTEINGQRAVADNSVQRRTETIDIEAVGGNCLPGELAASAEPTDIPYERKLSARCDLMPDACSHDGIDPFKVARACDRQAAGTLKLETRVRANRR